MITGHNLVGGVWESNSNAYKNRPQLPVYKNLTNN